MDQHDQRQRRDVVRLVALIVLALAAWVPLELVRRDVLPIWVFTAYVVVALAYAVLTLPSALRSIQRNRPAETGERYWTLD